MNESTNGNTTFYTTALKEGDYVIVRDLNKTLIEAKGYGLPENYSKEGIYIAKKMYSLSGMTVRIKRASTRHSVIDDLTIISPAFIIEESPGIISDYIFSESMFNLTIPKENPLVVKKFFEDITGDNIEFL